MSKGRNSSYPERPQGGKRPAKPGAATKRPSSEHVGGKCKGRIVKAVAETGPSGPRESYDKLAFHRAGHNPAGAVRKFLQAHIYNRVPIHVWGKHHLTIDV